MKVTWGKGIAYQFKQKYPLNNKYYEKMCKSGNFSIGNVLFYKEDNKIIANFPTKDKWRDKSQYSYIESGLSTLATELIQRKIDSIALPPLGCGNGGLDWNKVKQMILDTFEKININVFIYEPSSNFNSPQENIMSKMTLSHLMLKYVYMDNDKSIDTNKCSSLHISREDFDKIIEQSNESLIDAYSRMDMFNQPWTKHTPKEIDYIVPYIPSKDSVIIDVGCGTARHLAELYNRGYHNVFGYDFSSNLIEQAKEKFPYLSNSLFVSDCRNLCVNKKADVILCLYDVIGSFAKEEENIRIIKQIKKNTNKNAIVISSVMNFELTNHMAKHKFDVYANPEKLIKMASSLTMQKSGNVFNPDFYVIHKNSHIVFRKEMFKSDGYLDSEYIVRDRRYTKEQISKIFSKQGFNVLDSRYVQAGNWDKPLSNIDPKAKEILLVLKKE